MALRASTILLVNQDWLANIDNLLDVKLQVESLGQYDLEDFLNINGVTGGTEDHRQPHGFTELLCLVGDFCLILWQQINKLVVLRTDQKRNGGFVKTTDLPVPLLDGVQSRLSGEIKHE